MEEYKVELTEVSVVKKIFWKKADSPEEAIERVKSILDAGGEDHLERSPEVFIIEPTRFDFTASKVAYIKEDSDDRK